MKSVTIIFVLLSLMLVAACSSDDDPVEPNNNSPVAATPSEENNEEAVEEMPITPLDPWEVTEISVGLVEVGMTTEEASRILGVSLTPIGSTDSCHYVKPEGGPEGIAFMIIDGHIARIDVEDPSVATSVGAQIGDSEERIKMLYMNQVEVTPHKYTEGNYLTVVPANGFNRIIFETDGTNVTRYRAGRMPEVSWVEGCS